MLRLGLRYIIFVLRNGEATMDRMVARLNIEHYEFLLAKETDEVEREKLRRLLSEEREIQRKAELENAQHKKGA